MAVEFGNTVRHVASGIAAALLLATVANAQHSSGNITGAALTGDTVVVRGVDTGFLRKLSIKKDGRYSLRAVPAGEYAVTVMHADGKMETIKMVVVRVGSTARVQ